MKISVAVKPRAKKEGVELLTDGTYVVRVNEQPIDGRANLRVIDLLSQHFKCSKSSISLISGLKSKKKIFKIE